jgi:hypothetical protein
MFHPDFVLFIFRFPFLGQIWGGEIYFAQSFTDIACPRAFRSLHKKNAAASVYAAAAMLRGIQRFCAY